MAEEDLFIFLADISGYTSFMLDNQMAYTHATLAIGELMEALIKEIGLPLKISKLEGDAVFFYLLNKDLTDEMKNDPLLLSKKLLQMISLFSFKVSQMEMSMACQCGGCKNIDKLQLKIIVHYGKAAMVKIGEFSELSGVDVILAHRLLKNHIEAHRYILLTQQAVEKMHFVEEVHLEEQSEEIPDLGKIPIWVCRMASVDSVLSPKLSKFSILASHLKILGKIILLKLGISKTKEFKNLPPKPQ